MRPWHVFVCVGLVAAAAVVIATGAQAVGFVLLAGCALMMGAMVWMMLRGGGGDDRSG